MIICMATVGPNRELAPTAESMKSDIENVAIFDAETEGKTIVTGYNSWRDFGGARRHKELGDNRKIIVLFSSNRKIPDDLNYAYSTDPNLTILPMDVFVEMLKRDFFEGEDIYITGGEKIFLETFEYWDKIMVSEYRESFNSDRFFPNIKLEEKYNLVYEKEYTNFKFYDLISYDWIYRQFPSEKGSFF